MPITWERVAAMILDVLLDNCDCRAAVQDVRIGRHWTAVAVRRAEGVQAGLASALSGPEDHPHSRPPVRDAGRLLERSAADLAQMVRSDAVAEASVGLATLNALLRVDVPACVEVNAGEVLVERGAGKRVAIVGHFPFIPRVRKAARQLWVLELRPREGDLPAEQATEVLPQADVVGITGSTLVNHTFDELIGLCRPDAFVMVMGGSTPLSPLFFELGVDAVAGTYVVDDAAVLRAVSQGATFRQIGGKRLLTLFK
jgi:uncharacterized protein (DUF4213/DUF364 family)